MTLEETLTAYIALQKEHRALLTDYNALMRVHITVMKEATKDKLELMNLLRFKQNVSIPSLN